MTVNSKADLALLIKRLESALDEDQGGVTRTWSHLVEQWEAIESHACAMGIIRKKLAKIEQPEYVYLRNGKYDYQTPFKRIQRAIRTRIDAIKKRLKVRQSAVARPGTKWGKLRQYLLKERPNLPETHADRVDAKNEYNKRYAGHYTKVQRVETVAQVVRDIRKSRRKPR
jgi:hypothetical protein